jgi:hypothetical protein
MADSKPNWLQRRIGGPLSGHADRLVAAGKRALGAYEPKMARVLSEQQARLDALAGARELDAAALFDLAHDVRGLAGTFGYASLGLIADGLARYILACREAGAHPHDDTLRVLAQAMDQAFVKDSLGGPALADLTAGALAVVRAKLPAAAA